MRSCRSVHREMLANYIIIQLKLHGWNETIGDSNRLLLFNHSYGFEINFVFARATVTCQVALAFVRWSQIIMCSQTWHNCCNTNSVLHADGLYFQSSKHHQSFYWNFTFDSIPVYETLYGYMGYIKVWQLWPHKLTSNHYKIEPSHDQWKYLAYWSTHAWLLQWY